VERVAGVDRVGDVGRVSNLHDEIILDILFAERVHHLVREQLVKGELGEVFGFFAEARNLELITPPWLGFSLTAADRVEMRPGALIDYRLHLHGVPVRWTSRIAVWEPGRAFVDEQTQGPYRLWHHTHSFERRGEGTLVRDHVRYALPLGPWGELAHRLFVQRDLARIFDFRRAAVHRLLG
jgi:ligand-binding SRPBCC domain-containing protein